MNRKTIRLIIFLAVFTVIGVFSFQWFWVKKAFNLQERQFNERVHVALSNVVSEVQHLNHDSSAIYEPVKQISSNYLLASTNDTLHPYVLQNLLINEFKSRNLDTDFEYVLYDCFNDSIVFGDFVEIKTEAKDLVYEISEKDKWNQASHYFGVYFPSKELRLVDQMGIWVVSTIFLLLVVVFFSYTIWVILKQRKLSEIRTDFINNMTHELKTPISTISLSIEVLSNPNITKDPERLNNYANIIREETERLKNQVDKVLQMATLDKNKIDLNLKKVDIHKVIQKTIDGFELILNSNQGKIEHSLKANNSIVMGDEMHLTNIFFNLIDNAIKYSNKEPRIEISTTDHKYGFHIRIRDNGIGMNKEQQKHVFENFYRVPTGDRHDVKGFGIGLNYVKKMVKKHNGKIKLKSELKSGSTFRIYFQNAKNEEKEN
ncbi:MAG: HAMP domain-containing histidine kinase [Flavobacteriales bacterium]|nr:HAMP domain-containing histidine kinase [Flavobacteriales bacterium]